MSPLPGTLPHGYDSLSRAVMMADRSPKAGPCKKELYGSISWRVAQLFKRPPH